MESFEPWPPEPVEQLLGIEVVGQTEDRTVLEMTVTDQMLNDHGICHGGILFLLADATMGRASNMAVPSLATHAEVDFLEAVPNGSRLRSEARTRRQRGKMAIFDIAVTRIGADGETQAVAEFRGRTLQVRPAGKS